MLLSLAVFWNGLIAQVRMLARRDIGLNEATREAPNIEAIELSTPSAWSTSKENLEKDMLYLHDDCWHDISMTSQKSRSSCGNPK